MLTISSFFQKSGYGIFGQLDIVVTVVISILSIEAISPAISIVVSIIYNSFQELSDSQNLILPLLTIN